MNNTTLDTRTSQIIRIALGAIFGVVIAAMIDVKTDKNILEESIWRPTLIAAMALSAFVFWAALGAMRRFSILIWGSIAFSLVCGIFYHAIYQTEGSDDFVVRNIFWILPFLFISHELVSSGDQANSLIAPYDTYFDEAWKRGVQLILALGFAVVFWLILGLGAVLLNIIGMKWFGELISQKYFAIPATGMALGTAVHLGDVQSKLLNSFRNLVLSIFSWLLPLIVLVAGIFSLSLLATGLKPLWETKAATPSLLVACMFLVLLINAAYKDGKEIESKILKIAIRIASLETLIFALIAAYSLWLRIDQYGLTHERVLAAVGVIVASLFGLGYFLANFVNLKSDEFLPTIRQINIGMAFTKAAIFLCILTPIADPSRLSVNSQVNRLLAGKTDLQKFDYQFLRFSSGRYGHEALKKLTQSNNQKIKELALHAQNLDKSHAVYNEEPAELFKPQIQRLKIVYGTKEVPQSFLNQQFSRNDYNLPNCLRVDNANEVCYLIIVDANNDKQDEIFITSEKDYLIVMMSFENNVWKTYITEKYGSGENLQDEIKAGKVSIEPNKWNNLHIGNHIYKPSDK